MEGAYTFQDQRFQRFSDAESSGEGTCIKDTTTRVYRKYHHNTLVKVEWWSFESRGIFRTNRGVGKASDGEQRNMNE